MAHLIDKDALVAEIEILKLCTMDEHMKFYSESAEAEYYALCKVEEIIDSMKEEPKTKFEVGDIICKKEDKANKVQISAIDEDYYYAGSYNIIKDIADTEWELIEESKKCMFTKEEFTEEDRKILCEDCEEECECNITGISTLNARGKLKELLDNINEEDVKITRKQMEDEAVSEDLEEAAMSYVDSFLDGDLGFNPRLLRKDASIGDVNNELNIVFKAGAEWQRQQDEHLIWQISSANYEKGKQEAREEMIQEFNLKEE